ncbi:hypothetical protein I4U23_022389 [Adineta vaga]|nr:hypothetical protein I4U23_022389 [Adineta vaga]
MITLLLEGWGYFAGGGIGRPLIAPILFEIECSVEVSTKPFAKIQEYTFYKTENEVLFTLGTIFRIDSVEQYSDNLWVVNLTLCEQEMHSY